MPASRSTPDALPNDSVTSPAPVERPVRLGDRRPGAGRVGSSSAPSASRGIQTRIAATVAVGPGVVRDRADLDRRRPPPTPVAVSPTIDGADVGRSASATARRPSGERDVLELDARRACRRSRSRRRAARARARRSRGSRRPGGPGSVTRAGMSRSSATESPRPPGPRLARSAAPSPARSADLAAGARERRRRRTSRAPGATAPTARPAPRRPSPRRRRPTGSRSRPPAGRVRRVGDLGRRVLVDLDAVVVGRGEELRPRADESASGSAGSRRRRTTAARSPLPASAHARCVRRWSGLT